MRKAADCNHIVASVFAIIPFLERVRSSKRRPWTGGEHGRAVMKAFAFTSMPFVIAEAVTGVISFITGLLSIPPLMGAGTLVDAVILLTGLSIVLARLLSERHVEERPIADERG